MQTPSYTYLYIKFNPIIIQQKFPHVMVHLHVCVVEVVVTVDVDARWRWSPVRLNMQDVLGDLNQSPNLPCLRSAAY